MTDHLSFRIRMFDADIDDVSEVTTLLHRAYRPLAERGMRYLATHQDDSVTLDRLSTGEGYIVVDDDSGAIIGTVSFIPPGIGDPECDYYHRPGVAWFQQFAVDPSRQREGIGSRMMDFIEQRACEIGATEIALDTSDQADHLIVLYTGRGYEIVDEADWSVTNYRSVIMRKLIGGPR